MCVDNSAVDTIGLDLTFLEESVVISLNDLSETELSGSHNFLTTGVLGRSELKSGLGVRYLIEWASDREEALANSDSSRFTKNLTESTSHTLLESISTSAGKHLIDTNTMERMNSDSEMEVLSTDVNEHVLVGSNSGGFKSFRSDLLLFVTNKMDASWEKSVSSLLLTAIVHSNLGVWDTSVESGFWIRLVLLVPVAP